MESPNNSPTDELQEAIGTGDLSLVRKAIARGADVVSKFHTVNETPLGWATFIGKADIVELLIHSGAPVPDDALQPLGVMDITDWMIDTIELELEYARVVEILTAEGASAEINAYNGKPLIESFPAEYYPNIHRVLSGALTRSSDGHET